MTDVITQNLDVWSSAIAGKSTSGRGTSDKQTAYGIKKLRELILELAVRGKLVPQDSNDEPASILLSKIYAKNNKVNIKRKRKNSNELTLNSDYEKPFLLPIGWIWINLGAIGNIFNGNSVNSSLKHTKYTNLDGGLPFIATKDVGYGWEELEYDNGVSIPLNEVGFRVAHKNAVLICAEGGSAGKKCGITKQDICFGNKLFAIELYGEIEPSYILANYLSPEFFQQFSGKMTGIIGGISSASFSQLMIPLPPLAEQHRIVAKVDELMALCDQLGQQQADNIAAHQTLVQTLLCTLTQAANAAEFEQSWNRIADYFDILFTTEYSIDQLKQTLLQLAVMGKLVTSNPSDESVNTLLEKVVIEQGTIGSKASSKVENEALSDFNIPDHWIWQPLSNLLTFGPTNGYSPQAVSFETPVRSLTLSATTSGRFNGKHYKFIEAEVPADSPLWLSDGDILVQRGNTIEYVGVSVVYHGEPNQFIYPDLMMKLRVSSALNVDFVCLAMTHKPARTYLRARTTGTSGTMPKINQSTLKSLPIPIPPLAEQNRIVAKVDELISICDTIKTRIADVQTTQIQLADAIIEQAVV